MALPLNNFPPASFGGIEFPYTNIDIKGSLDHHVHKYLHRAGGEIEALGRHVYEFKFSILAHQVYRAFPDMYPVRLNRLINLCESEQTYELRVPPIGIYKAKAIGWTRSIVQAKKSGEAVELTFTEDNTEQFTIDNIVAPSVSALPTQVIVFTELMATAPIGDPLRAKINAFQAAVNDIVAQRDDALADVTLAEVQVQKAMGLCFELDAAPFFRDPTNSIEMRAFHDTWDTLTTLAEDRLEKNRAMGRYFTPRPMTIVDVALDLYKATAKTSELLRLNAFQNAMMIPAQTEVRYYPPLRGAA